MCCFSEFLKQTFAGPTARSGAVSPQFIPGVPAWPLETPSMRTQWQWAEYSIGSRGSASNAR